MKNGEIKIKWVGYELELLTAHATIYNQVVEHRSKVNSLEEAVESVFATYPKNGCDDQDFYYAEIYKKDVYVNVECPNGRKFYGEPKLLRRITKDEWYFKVYEEENN